MFDFWQFALCSWHCIFCICSFSATGGKYSLLKYQHFETHLYNLLIGLAEGVCGWWQWCIRPGRQSQTWQQRVASWILWMQKKKNFCAQQSLKYWDRTGISVNNFGLLSLQILIGAAIVIIRPWCQQASWANGLNCMCLIYTPEFVSSLRLKNQFFFLNFMGFISTAIFALFGINSYRFCTYYNAFF